MKKILFVCTGNTCRSPMAEVIFNSIAETNNLDYRAESAGAAAINGMSASKNAIKAVEEIGLDLTKHKTRFLPDVNLNNYDLFVTMGESHAQILESMGVPGDIIRVLQRQTGKDDKYDLGIGITDPFGGDLKTYEKCRDEIYSAVNDLIKTL